MHVHVHVHVHCLLRIVQVRVAMAVALAVVVLGSIGGKLRMRFGKSVISEPEASLLKNKDNDLYTIF